MSAPDDVSEVRDAHGRVVQIERDVTLPGAKRVFVIDPSKADTISVRWRIPACARRPEFYPAQVPFVPHIACGIMEGKTCQQLKAA